MRKGDIHDLHMCKFDVLHVARTDLCDDRSDLSSRQVTAFAILIVELDGEYFDSRIASGFDFPHRAFDDIAHFASSSAHPVSGLPRLRFSIAVCILHAL